MIENFDQKICEAFPLIFRDRHASIEVSCMPWGFEIDSGWHEMLWEMCKIIQEHIDANPETCEQVIATQVKEKFGTLRFYYFGGDEYIYDVVERAETLSAYICEVCGSFNGKLGGDNWYSVRCEEHA